MNCNIIFKPTDWVARLGDIYGYVIDCGDCFRWSVRLNGSVFGRGETNTKGQATSACRDCMMKKHKS